VKFDGNCSTTPVIFTFYNRQARRRYLSCQPCQEPKAPLPSTYIFNTAFYSNSTFVFEIYSRLYSPICICCDDRIAVIAKMPAPPKQRKIAIVGSRSVGSLSPQCISLFSTDQRSGKSSLTVQFVDGHFVESYYPTIENTFSKVIKFKGQEFATEIIDTAGQVSRVDKYLAACVSSGLNKSTDHRTGRI
jgi:hypothetical protein